MTVLRPQVSELKQEWRIGWGGGRERGTRVDIAQKLVFTEITNIQGPQGIRTSTNEDLAGSLCYSMKLNFPKRTRHFIFRPMNGGRARLFTRSIPAHLMTRTEMVSAISKGSAPGWDT